MDPAEVLAQQARWNPDRCWIEMTDGGTLIFGEASAMSPA
jgi:hypothetical protein